MPSSFKLRGFLKSVVIVVGMMAVDLVVFWPESLSADSTMVIPYSLVEQHRSLSRADLREIFFGRQTRWEDGSPLRVFVLPDKNPIHIRFAKEVLGIYPYQLRSAWDRMIYSGTGTPPVVVETLTQMQMQLRETPGSIGYIEE